MKPAVTEDSDFQWTDKTEILDFFLEFLDFQDSHAEIRVEIPPIESSFASVAFSIEELLQETKSVVTEQKEFEHPDELMTIALVGMFLF